MARRKDKGGFVELMAKLSILVVVLLFVAVGPKNFSAIFHSIIAFVICVIVLGVVVGFILIRKESRSRNNGQAFISHHLQTTVQTENLSTATINQPIAKANLVEQLRKIDWFQFEKLVALIYERQGYEVRRRGGANPDGGVDLIIEKDGQKQAVQCKQWKTWNVGVKAVREFLGALKDAEIEHGIFITLNGYTGDAKLLAEKHGIEIINETGLSLMLEGIQEDPGILEILNDTRKYCPKCERLMVERVAGKGPNPGQRFWGCSGYPKCRFTMPM